MFYQCICKNNHYTEVSTYRENCVDCHMPIIFVFQVKNNIAININAVDCQRDFKLLEKLKKYTDMLVQPQKLKELPLEKIVQLFGYFNNQKKCVLEWKMAKNQSNEYVPYVVAKWGKTHYLTSGEFWETTFLDQYGNEFDESNAQCDIYQLEQCYVFSYEDDLKNMIIELYTIIWNKKYKLIEQ